MIKLDDERMDGFGEFLVGEFKVNYLYGLNDLCQKYINKNTDVLELGSNNAVSTRLFCYHAKSVLAIDMNKTNRMCDALNENSNLKFIQTTFADFYSNNTHKFDLIYIDGSHEYKDVKFDIQNSIKLLKSNGVIAGHDYNYTCEGVIFAVNEFFTSPEVFSDSSWCKKF